MRNILEFHVEPALPEPMLRLREIASNLWWTWNPDAIDLFRRLDDQLWEKCRHNPIMLLGTIAQERLEQLAQDQSFVEFLDRVHGEFTDYLTAVSWYSFNYGKVDSPLIAYFSMEYGLTECLPIYSGGLGVLSGDHLKSASDLGLPLVGVGLLYQQGYFEQYLNYDGWQQERYPTNDFYNLPLEPVCQPDGSPLITEVRVGPLEARVKVWRCRVGRIPLYLLDTNLSDNSPRDRDITDQLYGGDHETRIRQEIILGIGGLKVLHGMGIRPLVCHMNEGHAAFLTLERIRFLVRELGISPRVARTTTFGGNVFTTHTPVPAGIDIFQEDLMKTYFASYLDQVGIETESFLKMGRLPEGEADGTFNMAIMALSNANFANAVSKLHRRVTRQMMAVGFPGIPQDEIPVHHVTNGIHLRSWISHDIKELFDRYLGSTWIRQPVRPDTWQAVERIPDPELWRTHERRRERLVSFARRRLTEQLTARGASAEEVARADEVLDPQALTIGFARRFAAYKRATLLLRQPERLIRVLSDPQRPVQLMFAGKAHPRDDAGKGLIKEIVHFARDERVRDRVVFLEDHNMMVTRYLVQGVDVWLNTPRRPLEASGTSGMKVAVNGGLNLSILDGWWDEAYTPEVGWAIGAGEQYTDPDYQDEVESNALYDLLEKEVVPLFYSRGRDGLPRGWIGKMKASISRLTPFFNSDRMVREYTDWAYLVAKAQFEKLSAGEFELGRRLSDWKVKVLKSWRKLEIESVNLDHEARGQLKVGDELTVQAIVRLAPLTPEDVLVEAVVGRLDDRRELNSPRAERMSLSKELGDGRYLFAASVGCATTGNHGLAVRLIPHHEDLVEKYELALVRWA